MVQPAWPFWPDLRVPSAAETFPDYPVVVSLADPIAEPFRDYDVTRPIIVDVPPGGPPLTPPPESTPAPEPTPPLRAAARVDLNAWRSPNRSEPTMERVFQGRVVTVLERAVPSRDPAIGEWWRVITPTGLEGYLAGTGPRGEPYLEILPSPPSPGLARALPTLTVQREPVPGDPCLNTAGCGVFPPHVIDPNAQTRIRRDSLRSSTATIPHRAYVDVLSPQVNVTVTERVVDGDVYVFFTPEILGTHTFYRIRYCYPGTEPLRCVEGWIERYNLVPGALPGRHTGADEPSFWEDVGDFVTDPDTWAVIGAVATAGSYGWVAGILGSAQSVALQEAMKGLAGMFLDAGLCVAAGNSVEECTIGERSPNFVNGWKAQVAIRARLAAVAAAGPGVASAKAALATKIGPDLVNAVVALANTSAIGGQYRDLEARWKQQNKSDEEIRNEFLRETQRQFANDPDPMKRREDVQAIAVNYHLRRLLFDVTHWDPATGRRRVGKRLGKANFDPNRPTSSKTRANYTVEQLEEVWRNAERRQFPPVVVDALRKRYERAKYVRDYLGIRVAGPSEALALRLTASGAPVEVSPDAIDIGGGDVGPDGRERLPFWKESLYGIVLTSPAWVPLALLPWLRKQWRTKRGKRGSRRSRSSR